MSVIGAKDITQLPSIWAEARSTGTLHNERRNINHHQFVTRTEVDALAHNISGPLRITTNEAPQVGWRAVGDISPPNASEKPPQSAREQTSIAASNQSNYSPYDYQSSHYNEISRNVYTPNPNPVVINRVV